MKYYIDIEEQKLYTDEKLQEMFSSDPDGETSCEMWISDCLGNGSLIKAEPYINKYITDGLELLLSDIQSRFDIHYGDISPEQTMEFSDIVNRLSKLSLQLVEQNQTD